jgi:hypothetical protein
MTVDTGAFVTVAREEAGPTVRSVSGVRRDDPGRERGAGRADSGAKPSEDLGVRRQYHRRVYPGAVYPTGLLHVG